MVTNSSAWRVCIGVSLHVALQGGGGGAITRLLGANGGLTAIKGHRCEGQVKVIQQLNVWARKCPEHSHVPEHLAVIIAPG